MAVLLVEGLTELGGYHHLVAPVSQCLTQNALAIAAAIDIGRVEKIDAQIQRPVDGADVCVDLVWLIVDSQVIQSPAQATDAGCAQPHGADLDAAFS
jgi:hypothetical protein